MSTRSLLNNYKRSVSANRFDARVNDDQRRNWLALSLAQLSDSKPIEHHHQPVNILASDFNVVLPPDFRNADDQALYAVEYGGSWSYASSLGIDLSYYSYIPTRPIYAPSRLRNQRVIPQGRITEASIYGRTRPVLRLYASSSLAREELLVYRANYLVTDAVVEITLTDNLTAGDVITVTIRDTDGLDVDYGFIAVAATPDSENYEFLIGQSAGATAANLSAALIAATTDTGLTSDYTGQVVRLFTPTTTAAEIDFTVTSTAADVVIVSIPGYSNLDSAVSARVFKLMESYQHDYISSAPEIPGLTDKLREISERKAIRLRQEALTQFQVLTV
jgi:hypothetical protein